MPDRIENNHLAQILAAQTKTADRPTADFEAVRQRQAALSDAATQPEQPRPAQETGPVAPLARVLNQEVANDTAQPTPIRLADRSQISERLTQLLSETHGRATIKELTSARAPAAPETAAETRDRPETRTPETRSVEPVLPSIEPAPAAATLDHIPAQSENATGTPGTAPILNI